jgi:hypothetical protein
MYFLHSRVILDQITKRYEEIITIKPNPHTNNYLSSITKLQLVPKRSHFESFEDSQDRCIFTFNDPQQKKRWCTMNEFPILITKLYENNYVIEKDVTKIMKQNTTNKEKLLCVIVEK